MDSDKKSQPELPKDFYDRADQEILQDICKLSLLKASPHFKDEVHGRIKERLREGRGEDVGVPARTPTLSSPWKRCKPWALALVAHAAIFLLIANIFLGTSPPNHAKSIRHILYQQRHAALDTSVQTAIAADGSVVLRGHKKGALVRVVPLEQCVGVFGYAQWKALASTTRLAYESEPGFVEMSLGVGSTLALNENHHQLYFESASTVTILRFVDRTEVWNSSTLQSYLDEYPVEIQQAVILPW